MTDPGARLERRIEESGVDHVLLEFGDLNGIARCEQVSAEHFLDGWREGFTIPVAILAVTPQTNPAIGSGWAEERNYADGVMRPVPGSFKVVPWLEDTGRVLCEFEHGGERVEMDPRVALRRVLDRDGTDPEFFVGSELEFYLFDVVEGGYRPATDDHPHEHVAWATEEALPFYRDLRANADAYDVPLNLLHHEWGPGQLEVLFEHERPLAAADRAWDFKRLVQQTARGRGQRGTFMAKPYPDQSGSGYHVHVSAWDGDENAFADGERLSETGRAFVGGVLEHADALVALGTPTINGYKRFAPGGFVPYTASWGYDNRMAGIRIPEGEPRVEVRLAGADANPYVVVASTLAAGLHGIEAGIDPGEPIDDRDPAGERPELERTPELAVRALEGDDVLCEALGEGFVTAYAATQRQGIEDFYATVTDWERETFVEMF